MEAKQIAPTRLVVWLVCAFGVASGGWKASTRSISRPFSAENRTRSRRTVDISDAALKRQLQGLPRPR